MKREKKLYNVITFKNSHDAIVAEKIFKKRELKGCLIPTPREISASCGTSWRGEMEDEEASRIALGKEKGGYDVMEKVWLY